MRYAQDTLALVVLCAFFYAAFVGLACLTQ
jgi:hypothetical protein